MIKSVSQKFNQMQKIWKVNFALFLLLVLAIGMLPSYAGDPVALVPGKCGAKIALVLDRSSSIGVGQYGGNQGNVDAIKSGSQELFNAIQGVDSYTDLYAFGSVAKRINTGPWFNVKDQDQANWQSMVMHGTQFKTGATNSSSGDLYDDGMAAGSEGLTNWEDALRAPIVSHAGNASDPFPDAIIIFTDGEPTTNNAETNAAIAAGGSYSAAGNPGVDGTDADDLSAGFNMANFARALGIRVIPVAIGDFSGANGNNLQTLAAGETVYKSNNFADLGNLLKSAAADVCAKPVRTTVAFSALEKTADGYKNIVLPISLDGSISGTINTTGDPASPWASRVFDLAPGATWESRMLAQIPDGYRAVSERCERDKWNGQAPLLEELENSVGVNGHILVRQQPAGGVTYCEFVIEKNPDTPVSTLRIIATDKNSGVVLPAKFDYSNSPFTGPQFETTAGGTWSSKTAQPTSNWGFNTSWVAGSTPGYTFDSVSCTPAGVVANQGINSIAGGYAPGTTVSCEYKFVKIPAGKAELSVVKKVNGQDAPTSNPLAVRVGDKLVYSFEIRNIGEIPVKEIKLVDSVLTSKRSDALQDCISALNGKVLAVNETFTCNAREITVPVDSPTTVRNIAVVNGIGVVQPGQSPSNPAQVQDDANIKIVKPIVSIDKKVNPTVLSADGQSVTYTITATNTGDASYEGTITDGLLGISKTVSIAPNGGSVTITIVGTFNLSAKSITFLKSQNVDLPSDKTVSISTNSLTNTACIKEIALCDDAKIDIADLSITKTAIPTVLNINQNGKYVIVVKNTGKTQLNNVVIKDDSLKQLFEQANDGVNNNVKTTFALTDAGVSCDNGQDLTLQIEESCTVNISYQMTQKLADLIKSKSTSSDASFTNVATVSAKTVIDGVTLTRQDDATIIVEHRMGWTFRKTASSHVARPGDTITYTFKVVNTGETILPSVTVTDATIGKTVVIPGPIAIGATATATVDYVLPANYSSTNFVNLAKACVTGSDDCKHDDELVYIPKVQLDKTGPATATAGDKVTYKFVVKNIGETDLTDIVINDATLSTLLGKEVKITVPGTLKPGQSSAQISYEATIPASYKEKSFKNIAIVTATPIDPVSDEKVTDKPVTDDDDHTISLSKWHSTKSADKTSVKPGETINYTITVFNDSDVALTNVEVSDPTIGFPADGKPVKVDIPANSKIEIKASYVVPANYDKNTFKNVAVVCVPKTGQNADCENPEVEIPVVRIEIVKKADKVQALVGDEITFSFDVTNKSGIDLVNVRVVDSKVNFDQIIPLLKAGETKTVVATNKYVVTAADLTAEKLTNIVSACAPVPGRPVSAQSDCTPGEEPECVEKADTVCDDDEITIPVINPTIAIVKTADKTSASVGDTVNYTFVITNTSKTEIRNITVTDNVLGDLGTIDKLAPGASVTKTKAYVLPVGTPATLRNVATACFAAPVVKNNCASDDHVLSVVAVLGTTIVRPTTPTTTVLPFTGSTTDIIIKSILWLMLLGSAFILITRRKPREA